jgi:hypothetical protein
VQIGDPDAIEMELAAGDEPPVGALDRVLAAPAYADE